MTRVLIPEGIWRTLLDELARHAPDVERVAYLDGFLVDHSGYPAPTQSQSAQTQAVQHAVVTALVLPDAELAPGNYRVKAEAMSQAGGHLLRLRMTRLVQVHTHGNGWVDHSPTDDARAYSQRSGALSIVVPHHGRRRPDPAECGVHVRTERGWQRLAHAELADHIQIVPSTYDYRDPACLTESSTPRLGTFSRLTGWLMGARRRSPRT